MEIKIVHPAMQISQREFWDNESIKGLAPFRCMNNRNNDDLVFWKDAHDGRSGFILDDNSYSHSNGNFLFWANGETITGMLARGVFYYCERGI